MEGGIRLERITYDFFINGIHCIQVKGADNLECKEVCEKRGDEGCKGCPIAKAFDRLGEIEDILGDDYDLDRLREMVAEVNTRKFASGQEVWVVERENGEATEYSGYVCVAQVDMAVIVSPYINGSGDIVDMLSDQIEQTAEGGTGDLEVYPISDCYETKEEASEALKGEQNV